MDQGSLSRQVTASLTYGWTPVALEITRVRRPAGTAGGSFEVGVGALGLFASGLL